MLASKAGERQFVILCQEIIFSFFFECYVGVFPLMRVFINIHKMKFIHLGRYRRRLARCEKYVCVEVIYFFLLYHLLGGGGGCIPSDIDD